MSHHDYWLLEVADYIDRLPPREQVAARALMELAYAWGEAAGEPYVIKRSHRLRGLVLSSDPSGTELIYYIHPDGKLWFLTVLSHASDVNVQVDRAEDTLDQLLNEAE